MSDLQTIRDAHDWVRWLTDRTMRASRGLSVDELHRTTGHEPFVLRGATEVTEQIEGRTLRRIVAARDVDSPPCVALEHSEEVDRPIVMGRPIVDPDSRLDHVHVPMSGDRVGWRQTGFESCEPADHPRSVGVV